MKTGTWAVAGTALAETYPCRCYGDRACGSRCPCRGRPDVETMPKVCCARRAAETKERAAEGTKWTRAEW